MHRQSEEALGRLKALVEKILREEETKLGERSRDGHSFLL